MRLAFCHFNLQFYHDARYRALIKHLEAEVHAILIGPTAEYKEVALNPCEVSGYRVHTLPSLGQRNDGSAERAGLLVRKLDLVRPDGVFFMGGYSSFELLHALKWCKSNRVAAILLSESKEDDCERKWWKESVKSGLLGNFDAAVTGGTVHKQYLMSLGVPEERIFCGYDIIDNDFFSRCAAKVRESASDASQVFRLPLPFFLVVCRLDEKKNLFRLLQAYRDYRQHTPRKPWSLVIVGGGFLEEELKSCAGKMHCEGILWAGYVSWQHLPWYYGLSSAFILPSTTEQWGLVVNEAMASGLPVLVSKTAGCRYELVKDGENGYLFDPYDVGEIANAMLRMTTLTEEQRQAMARRSRQIIAEWGPERFARAVWSALQAAKIPRKRGILSRGILAAAASPFGSLFL